MLLLPAGVVQSLRRVSVATNRGRAAAHHEAGHAVVGIQLGFTVTSMNLESTCFAPFTAKTPHDALALLTMTHAGGIAQMKLPFRTCSCPSGCIAGDERENAAILDKWFAEQREDATATAKALAVQTVERFWPQITGLAHVLQSWHPHCVPGEFVALQVQAFR